LITRIIMRSTIKYIGLWLSAQTVMADTFDGSAPAGYYLRDGATKRKCD
jgi:hypothetical protein